MYCVTLTVKVWTLVKITAHRLNKDNICTKLYGPCNLSMYKKVKAPTQTMCTLTFKCLV